MGIQAIRIRLPLEGIDTDLRTWQLSSGAYIPSRAERLAIAVRHCDDDVVRFAISIQYMNEYAKENW